MPPAVDNLSRASALDGLATKTLINHSSELNERLSNALATSAANGLPPITISPLQGQYLAIQCRLMNAKRVLEIGTLGGYSSIWFASAGASVTSIEIDPKHREVALRNTKGLDVDVILGAALDVLPKLASEGRVFDLVFIDADWDEQFEYFRWAVKLTRPGGAVYVDNVVRCMLEDERPGGEETLVARVGKMKGVQATLVSTVGSHKSDVDQMFDGFLLAVVDGE
ncbi:hypothetical protein MBLNU457_1999t1 [Dothideomycetes sp. NU457]